MHDREGPDFPVSPNHFRQNGAFINPSSPSNQVVSATPAPDCHLAPGALLSPERRAAFLQVCHNGASIDLSELLNYPVAERFEIIRFLAQCPACTYLGPAGNHLAAHDSFDAILELVQSVIRSGGIVCSVAIRQVVVESAVVIKGPNFERALRDAARVLGALKIPDTGIRILTRRARELQQALAESSPASVLEALPDAPVGPDARVPAGWGLSSEGVFNLGSPGRVLIPVPLLVSGRVIDDHTDEELWQLAYVRDGHWKYIDINRGEALSARTLVNAARFGLPINSVNARHVVQFLSDYEHANLANIPIARQIQRLGWIQSDPSAFIAGDRYYSRSGSTELIDPQALSAQKWPAPAYVFRGDDGQQQVLDGFSCRGSLSDWQQAVAPLRNFPRVQLPLYAALVAPLIKLLGISNFALELCSRTSQGKTTALMAAGSLFGCPELRSCGSVLGTWDATRTSVERLAATCCDLPLILDDTKRAKWQSGVPQFIYDFCSGRGRGRGSLDGLRRTTTSRGVLLMSGESPAVAFSQDGGTRARVIEVRGVPFGKVSPDVGRLVQQLRDDVCGNYGHPGRKYVEHVVRMERQELQRWRGEFRALQDQYRERAAGNSVLGRLGESLAAITVAAQIAHQADILPWAFCDPVEALWDELVVGVEEHDPLKDALKIAYDYAVSNPTMFYSKQNRRAFNDFLIPNTDKGAPPPGGWAGRWDWPSEDCRYLGFIQHRLDERLRHNGHDFQATVAGWQERGWLLSNLRRGRPTMTFKARIGGPLVNLVAIRWDVIQKELLRDEAVEVPAA